MSIFSRRGGKFVIFLEFGKAREINEKYFEKMGDTKKSFVISSSNESEADKFENSVN